MNFLTRLASYEPLIWTIPPSLAYYPLLSQLSFYWYKGNKDFLAEAWIEISKYCRRAVSVYQSRFYGFLYLVFNNFKNLFIYNN